MPKERRRRVWRRYLTVNCLVGATACYPAAPGPGPATLRDDQLHIALVVGKACIPYVADHKPLGSALAAAHLEEAATPSDIIYSSRSYYRPRGTSNIFGYLSEQYCDFYFTDDQEFGLLDKSVEAVLITDKHRSWRPVATTRPHFIGYERTYCDDDNTTLVQEEGRMAGKVSLDFKSNSAPVAPNITTSFDVVVRHVTNPLDCSPPAAQQKGSG